MVMMADTDPKSPWKTPSPSSTPPPLDAAVSDSRSWPALSSLKPDDALTTTTSPKPQQNQVSTEVTKTHGRGNHNFSPRQPSRQHKAANKHNPNTAPSFHGPLPFHQPPIPPVYGGMAPWPAHIPIHGYAYPPAVGAFPPASSTATAPPRGNPNSYGVEFPNRRPNMQEKPLGPKENNDVHPNAGPRAFIRPPFFAPPAGFMGAPVFPGPPGSIVYLPAMPPYSVRVPHPPFVVPHQPGPTVPMLPAQAQALRVSVRTQIEYYFSDQNLLSDRYLISLMDDQGWVPISTIADFKRVKSMSTDILLIVDALQSSSTLEVQGEKVRKREDWSKWIPASVGNNSSLSEERSIKQSEKTKTFDSFKNDASGENLDKVCDDFASTFMFDEELELEHKDQCSSKTRVDDEDDEMVVNDQAVERLVIVTQQNNKNGRGTKGSGEETKSFSNELASAINDGLYYYEQELKSKRNKGRRNNTTNEIKGGTSKSPKVGSYIANQKAAGGGGDVAGSPNSSRRKQNKGFFKQQSLKNQRWFSGSLKNNGSDQIISESPPSSSVGFFFGSTPPDNHGLRSSKLGVSPHGGLTLNTCITLIILSSMILLAIPSVLSLDQDPVAVEQWFENLPNMTPKLTHLHFYLHDLVSGSDPTVFRVAQSNITSSSPTAFGFIAMADDMLTTGPEPNSTVLGRAQGIYGSACLEESGLLMTMNLVFTGADYNGSTLSLLGRNAVFHRYREMPIVGGSGVFRMARGVATAKTYEFNLTSGDAVVEYNVMVQHYN